ncbi:hypothetical protein H632_c5256p0 [Helicosporidium sp. ATCC 50920]|nr:hypothetical protein H632_c5256p0 [Helicosporidium sp. ATCC 50920]|eukprot:KDD71342.1 hypothetical protein H632_c5256p0 [Helicosporidium sp. ATCC 50920]
MMAELETYIRATRESQGAEITILKQGYLLKQSSYFRREWRRRFFVLDSQGMFYYYSEKEKSGKDMQAKNTGADRLLCCANFLFSPCAHPPSLRSSQSLDQHGQARR